MTLNPRVQQLSSRADDEGDLTLARLELTAGKQSARLPVMRWLHGWAECHQGKFGKKGTQHGLIEIDMIIVHGEVLRAGSNNKDYGEFLNWMEIRANRAGTTETEEDTTIPGWLIQLGIGCAFLAMCWIGGQLCFKGFQTTRRGEDNPEIVRYWSCLLYTSPSPRDGLLSRMPSSA